jgi:apolipoprotein N-acyltransferase
MIKKLNNLKLKMNPLFLDMACGMFTALLFSAFIYLEFYGFTYKLLNTLLGISALAMLLYIPKRAVLAAGFFIGLLWFYWIGYSFKYNGVGYMEPLIIFGFALIYMVFFGVLALSNNVFFRAAMLFLLSFIEPFDFNWLQIELLFVDSYIGVFKYQLALVLLALALPSYLKKPYTYAPLFLLLIALNLNAIDSQTNFKDAPLKIKLIATDIKQAKKWMPENKDAIIVSNILEIKQAIKEGYDVVVLPESCFPLYMNTHPVLQSTLNELSYDISIIAGALFIEDGNNFNVTYFFQDGKTEIAKKMVLVPFGEYIPLPAFARKFINDMFFAGQSDFIQAKVPTDFMIKGIKFRNAICYEATCQELYEGDVDFMIAISNNAWFAPSIEPTIQKLLMRFYARKNGVTIYHAANWKGSGVIK